MSDLSLCPITKVNLDEEESIFVWELTVPTSKTQEIKERLHKNDFQDCQSILKCLFKWHLLRNSFVGPASFNFFLDKNMNLQWKKLF